MKLNMNLAMSESGSIHSDRLFSIAREISGMGLYAFDCMEESTYSVSYIHCFFLWLFFLIYFLFSIIMNYHDT